MDKVYVAGDYEQKLYQFWEEQKLFNARLNTGKKPFCIILPPPNANANLHAGHAMMVYGDILSRYHRLKGDEVLWLPGEDHAGFETQYVFEKHLKKQGKSRFDYSREDLYNAIWDFVQENKANMQVQLRRLGFSLDWEKSKFTLDEEIVKIVYRTFKRMFDAGLIYRDNRLVNYCTSCGTSFSDREVERVEKRSPLYYLKYGEFVVATTRPETMFGDVAIAVHPDDKRYRQFIGQIIKFKALHGQMQLKVIADDLVDPKFGTGAVKITPAHDYNDFNIAKRHGLEFKEVIDKSGRLTALAGRYAGLKAHTTRDQIVKDLQSAGMIEKIDENYTNVVNTCYKCGQTLEPLLSPQWYVSVRPLAERVKQGIKNGEVKFYQPRFQKIALQWLDNFKDWNISRQIVWGIRIPAWYSKKENKWYVYEDFPSQQEIDNLELEQETDTFDTWFSSGQWPFATLQAVDQQFGLNSEDKNSFYQTFYPTTVMETAIDILPWWVLRMLMLGYFATDKPQFRHVLLHSLVLDKHGQKMSKSKGNVINPMDFVDKYGADALRTALIFGVKEGSEVPLSEDKVKAMRNFTNKLWNIGRFIHINNTTTKTQNNIKITIPNLTDELNALEKKYHLEMKLCHFAQAFGNLYEYTWHVLADKHLETLKPLILAGDKETLAKLEDAYLRLLVMLHPFMPFVTEAIWQILKGQNSSIMSVRF